MQKRYFFLCLLASTMLYHPARAENVTLYPAEEVSFSATDGGEIAYDKENKPLSGAVVLPDETGRKITYIYKDGLKNGVAFANYDNGQMAIETTYQQGKKNGEEILFYPDGKPQHKKTYKDDVLEGEEIIFYPNGKPRERRAYVAGQLDGEFYYLDENENVQKIETYKNGVKNGLERIVENNMLIEENNYVDGVLDGVTKKYNQKYMTDEISYKQGKKNGWHKMYQEDGSRIEIEYVNDEKSGTGIIYFPDKSVAQRVSYWHNQKTGLSEKYYRNGKYRALEYFKNDKKDGISRYFGEQGNLQTVSYYVEDTELAKINVAEHPLLKDIYSAYLQQKLSNYINKKNLWYPILWLGLNGGHADMLQELEKQMNMYGSNLADFAVYRRESNASFDEFDRTMFFGLTPLGYAVNLAAPTDILQKLSLQPENINLAGTRGTTPLQEAIRLNDLTMVKYLLLHGADVKTANAAGQTILLTAIQENARPEIIAALIKAGADVNAADKQGRSPLQTALKNKDTDLIEVLLQSGAQVPTKMPDGMTVAEYAYVNQMPLNIFTALLTAGVNVNELWHDGDLLLLRAVKDENIPLVQTLLAHGADTVMANSTQESALTYVLKNPVSPELEMLILTQDIDWQQNIPGFDEPLWQVLLQQNKIEQLRLVLDKMGVEPTDEDAAAPLNILLTQTENAAARQLALSYIEQVDDRLLWLAVNNKDLDLLQKLVAKGGNVNAVNADGDTLLLYMVKNKYEPDFLRALQQENLQVDAVDKNNQSALQYALQNIESDTAQCLLDLGAQLNTEMTNGAALADLTEKQKSLLTLLLNNGADLQYVNPQTKETLLMSAVKNLNEELFKLLIAQNIHITDVDDNGNSAVHYIAEAAARFTEASPDTYARARRMVQTLINSGIKVNAQNYNGETVLIRLAQKHVPSYADWASMLISLGADAGIKDQYQKNAADYLPD